MFPADVISGCGASFLVVTTLAAAFLLPSSKVSADSFVMRSGKIIEGNVAGGSDVSVFVKVETGLLESLILADVKEVKVDLLGGERIVGELTGFRDDVYEILVDEWTLHVRDGRVIQSVIVRDDEVPAITPNVGGPAVTPNVGGPAVTPNVGGPAVTPNVSGPAVDVETLEPETATEPDPADKADLLKRAPM